MVVAGAQGVHGRDDLVGDVGHDPRLAQVDARRAPAPAPGCGRLVSRVRPDRISSPIVSMAAVGLGMVRDSSAVEPDIDGSTRKSSGDVGVCISASVGLNAAGHSRGASGLEGLPPGRLNKDGIRSTSPPISTACAPPAGWSRRLLDGIAADVAPGVDDRRARRADARDDPRGGRDARRPSATRATATRPASRSTTSSATASRRTSGCKDGDILNIDVTVILDGWYGDTRAGCTWPAPRTARPSA